MAGLFSIATKRRKRHKIKWFLCLLCLFVAISWLFSDIEKSEEPKNENENENDF
jgi:hypothetical protein